MGITPRIQFLSSLLKGRVLRGFSKLLLCRFKQKMGENGDGKFPLGIENPVGIHLLTRLVLIPLRLVQYIYISTIGRIYCDVSAYWTFSVC